MSSKKFVRSEMLPLKWCDGCGINSFFYMTADVFEELEKEGKNFVVVSGIGCTGRVAAHFNLDSVHGLHGRAIPLAVGVKQGNPKLDVVVISGDGDLLEIGIGHFVHSARRNDNITIICNSNEVFGMTGGQVSPTTRLGAKTITTPQGNLKEPINIQDILLSNKNYFYARTSHIFPQHFKDVLKQAINHKGFSFVEVISPCVINFSRRLGQGVSDIMADLRSEYKIIETGEKLRKGELGVVKND